MTRPPTAARLRADPTACAVGTLLEGGRRIAIAWTVSESEDGS